jgi:hypothetical protein
MGTLLTSVLGAAYIIYYILNLAYDEMKDASIQSKEDQQSH